MDQSAGIEQAAKEKGGQLENETLATKRARSILADRKETEGKSSSEQPVSKALLTGCVLINNVYL